MATSTEQQQQQQQQEPWYLRYTIPILFPSHDGFDLSVSQSTFNALVQDIVTTRDDGGLDHVEQAKDGNGDKDDSFTVVSAATTSQELRGGLNQLDLNLGTAAETPTKEFTAVKPNKSIKSAKSVGSQNSFDLLQTAESTSSESGKSDNDHPFIQGLVSHGKGGYTSITEGDMENKMLTANADIAYRSTKSSILDLFTELEAVVSGPRLFELLNAAWREDSLATLKIIFNARSIHLGKASQATFYRCAGWLAQHHPLTLIANLRWLSRPVIQKKVGKKEEADSDMVMVDVKPEKDAEDVTQYDVRNGVSHGYWKDLLNILVLGVEGKLDVLVQPKDILYVEKQKKSGKAFASKQEANAAWQHEQGKAYVGRRGQSFSSKEEDKPQHQKSSTIFPSKEESKTLRHDTRDTRHDKAVTAFNSDPVYRGLYLTVTRLFAEQLEKDLALLNGDDAKAKRNISLCAKWAPSHDRFHDKHTFIVSSISEMLYPMTNITGGSEDMDRELYLRHARERYRKDVAALRAHLGIVERNLTAKTYDKIKYDRVPSLAMNNYAPVFAAKDTERFEKYIDSVAEGKMSISGATLLPSTLIHTVRHNITHSSASSTLLAKNPKAAIEAKMKEINAKVVDGQWKTLVQRIKDSGTLESSIAVCDVSGSMGGPVFGDGTCPMDSAIGLSLLLAEVTAPPFGGHFITFSAQPQVESIDMLASLHDKVTRLSQADWGMNTNFVAVFEKLILPMAIRNKLPQEDMVKRVFVFSDMQFDSAQSSNFSGSFERIKSKYADAGYEMPELIFWNLAGGRAGYGRGTGGDPTAPKPVTSDETGTALVSGYSQGMLKVFLDNGSFDEPEDEDDVKTTEDGDAVVVDSQSPAKKRKIDPMSTVKKAIGHKAYDPLKVVD
ncbi:hypothetical protein HD806DRAFT_123753 [Xylariaceae sp. AK1471]|nr:hypothetical protein HD806DRAFT_123753 [Xylariaceae sp. AK1471]